MRITGPSSNRIFVLAIGLLALSARGAAPETPYTRIAKLASYISDGEPVGALEAFDKTMPRYQAIAENLQALAAQDQVLCSIDVVEDKEADDPAADTHHLDLDWYMTVKLIADPAHNESRRKRVQVTVHREKGAWRITSFAPEAILDPLILK